MGDSGCGFICSKAGIVKLLVLIFGCATWAIFVASGRTLYGSPKILVYVLVAYIVSWAVSLMLYFVRVTGLHHHLNCSCLSWDTFDYFWSWISCVNFISATVIFACFYNENLSIVCRGGGFCKGAMQLTVIILGIVTGILYAIEAQILKAYAPVGAGYGTTWRGIWKMIILIVGGIAFGLLVRSGINCGRRASDCTIARTFVLVAWCLAWGVAALIYLLRICMCPAKFGENRQVGFGTFEFFWSAFACLLYLIGAAVLAAFLLCSSFRSGRCRQILVSDICGFVTAVLFGLDAFFLKDYRPVWFASSRRVQSSGGSRTVTTTTTTKRTRS